MNSPVIVWFRRNLRLTDNAPLIAAAESGAPIYALFAHSDQGVGGAGKWWLHHSLVSLDASLARHGGTLNIYSAPAHDAISVVVEKLGARGVYFARGYDPASRDEERLLGQKLPADVDVLGFDDALLNPPGAVLTQSGTPYKVFTPFWNAAMQLGEPQLPQPAPATLKFIEADIGSRTIDSLELLPTNPDWSGGLADAWQPGEEGALLQLDMAVDKAADYKVKRDRPDLDGTSRLSPHLHFGELSVRQAWHAIQPEAARAAASAGVEALLRQLFWRDFSSYLLYHFPHLPEKPLRPNFEHFPWTNDSVALQAWQQGQTGYPLIDAGMRQLWTTGWMHNRVRMIVASFLVKNLMIDWQTGAHWFLDTLVDADLGNNSAGWQWVAGSGTDSTPYFRIFNPVVQSAKFDPDGIYIRRWVPELSDMPTKYIHEPWKADGKILDEANVRLGQDYPLPIVDLGETRQRALDAYQVVKGLQ